MARSKTSALFFGILACSLVLFAPIDAQSVKITCNSTNSLKCGNCKEYESIFDPNTNQQNVKCTDCGTYYKGKDQLSFTIAGNTQVMDITETCSKLAPWMLALIIGIPLLCIVCTLVAICICCKMRKHRKEAAVKAQTGTATAPAPGLMSTTVNETIVKGPGGQVDKTVVVQTVEPVKKP